MQTISVKEFGRKPSTYLDEAYAGEEIIITKHGKGYVRIVNCTYNEPKILKTVEEVHTILKGRSGILEYGCGCPKTEDNLCPKHGRA